MIYFLCVQSGQALIHDAVRMFASSVREYSLFNDIEVGELDCQHPEAWNQGKPILDLVDKVILHFRNDFLHIFVD